MQLSRLQESASKGKATKVDAAPVTTPAQKTKAKEPTKVQKAKHAKKTVEKVTFDIHAFPKSST